VTDLTLQLPAELVAAIAEQVLERVRQELNVEQSNEHAPRWLYGARAVFDYFDGAIPLGKIQKLTAAAQIPHYKVGDGQRNAYRTDELDAWMDQHREGPARLRAVG
jgi:hypothetical protein